jgi:hypothetical protein
LGDLRLRQNSDFSSWGTWWPNLGGGVLEKDLRLDGVFQGLGEGPVNVKNRLCCEPCATTILMSTASLALEFRLERFNMYRREFSDRDVPNSRSDIVGDNLSMSQGCLCGYAAFNVHGEPVLKVFREAHFGGIDVRPLSFAIEDACEFGLGLPFRPLETDMTRNAVSREGITSEVEFEFPAVLASGA